MAQASTTAAAGEALTMEADDTETDSNINQARKQPKGKGKSSATHKAKNPKAFSPTAPQVSPAEDMTSRIEAWLKRQVPESNVTSPRTRPAIPVLTQPSHSVQTTVMDADSLPVTSQSHTALEPSQLLGIQDYSSAAAVAGRLVASAESRETPGASRSFLSGSRSTVGAPTTETDPNVPGTSLQTSSQAGGVQELSVDDVLRVLGQDFFTASPR